MTQIGYDETGQPVTITDANLNQTKLSYADNYTSDDGSPSGNTNTYLTTITRPTTNNIPHVSTYQYDFNKGELRKTTDENLQVSNYSYGNDPGIASKQRAFRTEDRRHTTTMTQALIQRSRQHSCSVQVLAIRQPRSWTR